MLKDDPTSVELTTGDLEIGAVEIKNSSDDQRAAVLAAASSAAGTTASLAVADGNLHDSLGAVGAAADADGVIHGQLRSIAENTDALPAALGSAADAASFPVTQSTEDKAVLAAMSAKLPASLGVKAAAASLSVTQSTEDAAKVPALGAAAMAASRPVTIATDDTHFGAVGAAASADGVVHAQLHFVADTLTSVGSDTSSIDGKIPAKGVALSAASTPVVLASDDAHLGAVGAAADPDGVLHAQLRSIAENTDAFPAALGAAAMAASIPVTIATDDTHFGAVGAATDVDGVVHAQLRYIGEAVDALPTALGSAADAASLPVTQSTEDKAVLAAMSAKLPASLGSKADAASLAVTQSTEDKAVLAAMSAKLPASLGVKAAAASLSVTQSTEDAAKVPALGTAAMAASRPVTLATDDTQYGAVGAAASATGGVHAQLRSIAENTDTLPSALGVALSAASLPVVLASDDAHLGAVGAAAAVDGGVHAQLRYAGAVLGATNGAAVVTDADGTAQQYLRGLVKVLITALGSVGAASDVDGVLHGQLRYIGEAANTISGDIDDVQSGTFFDASTAGGSRTFTDATARTGALTAGLYAVSANQTCHIKTGPNASVEAAVGACTRLPVDTIIGVVIDGTNDAIAAIRETTSGTLYYSKVG